MLSMADFKGQKLLYLAGAAFVLLIVAAFFLLQQQKAGSSSMEAIQDSIVTAAQRNDTVRSKTTIVDYMQKNLDKKSLGDYKIKTDKAYVLNVNGAELVEGTGDLGAGTLDDIGDAEVGVVFIPNKQSASFATGVATVTSKATTANPDVTKASDLAKGYVTDGYIALFGNNWNEDTAKDFAEKYFPAGTVVKLGLVYGVATNINA